MITLYRRNIEKNLYRFYVLSLQSDLFGNMCLVQEWGRIGSGGQVRGTIYASEEEANAALEKKYREKEKRGYINI